MEICKEVKKEEKPGEEVHSGMRNLSLIPQWALKHKFQYRHCFARKQGLWSHGLWRRHDLLGTSGWGGSYIPCPRGRCGHWQPTPPVAGRWVPEPGQENLRGSPTVSVTRNVGHLEGIGRDVEMLRIFEWQEGEREYWELIFCYLFLLWEVIFKIWNSHDLFFISFTKKFFKCEKFIFAKWKSLHCYSGLLI